ncbi:MAG: NDP-hexose 2,3-dehydratase family protein [Acidobacteria bacterium]|nr:NDP-hexose 2,3-dehydratase family protein [Acidobacteriota bacterium]
MLSNLITKAEAAGNDVCETGAARHWLDEVRAGCDMVVQRISLRDSKEWQARSGAIRHRSGGYFSVVGVDVSVEHRGGYQLPMIDQPEIGLLGLVLAREHHQTWLLLQAKPEPGNVRRVQAAPTVQATESNFTRIHGGRPTRHLDLFTTSVRPPEVSSLQSEQGSCFLGKRNRNACVVLNRPDPSMAGEAFRWFNWNSVRALFLDDFSVNTDARSVIACTPWNLLSANGGPFAQWRGTGGFGELLLGSSTNQDFSGGRRAYELLMTLRSNSPLKIRKLDLAQLQDWNVSDDVISPERGGLFEVRFVAVTTSQREVAAWDQPLFAHAMTADHAEHEVVLACGLFDGLLRFCFVARHEPGFPLGAQLGPTIQTCGAGLELLEGAPEREVTSGELVAAGTRLLSCLQSDEGGRFYHCVTRYSIVFVEDIEHWHCVDVCWLSLAEVQQFLPLSGIFTNEARSALSMILAMA